ncbi:hypothetical protein GCM10023116_48350 [Kistimonas scapharcae]|uniref:Uncharacterized protein n=1 Tax=Kistimonas scapharcae TaxID=1036133 RepID=A0ABP8VAY4_9GAMM
MLNIPWGNVYGGYRDRNEQVEDRRNVQRKANIDSMAAMQQIIAQSPGITPEQAAGLYRQMNPGAPSDWIADYVNRQNQEYTHKQQLQQRQEQRQVRTSRLANMQAMQQLIANSPGMTPEQGIELWKKMDPNAPGEWVANFIERQNQQHAVKQQQNQLAMRSQEMQFMGQVDAMRDNLIMQLGNDASPQQLGQALVGQLGQGSEQYVQRSLSGVQNLGQHRQTLMTKALGSQMDTIKSLPVAARGDYLRQQFPGFGDELAMQYENDARYEILKGLGERPEVFSQLSDDELLARANRERERQGLADEFSIDEINQTLGSPAYRDAAYKQQKRMYDKGMLEREERAADRFAERKGMQSERIKLNAQAVLEKDSNPAAAALGISRKYLLDDDTIDFVITYLKDNEEALEEMMPSAIESMVISAAMQSGYSSGFTDEQGFVNQQMSRYSQGARPPLPSFEGRFKEYDKDIASVFTPDVMIKAFTDDRRHIVEGAYDPAIASDVARVRDIVEADFEQQKQAFIQRIDQHISEVEAAIDNPRYFGMYGNEKDRLSDTLSRLYRQKEILRQTPAPDYEISSTLIKDPTGYR